MMIKTSDGERSVASAGVGGTGLGLSIGALSLALLRGNGCGGGLLGNLFGNWGNGCGGCGNGFAQAGLDLYSNHDSRIISSLESALANERAERYADMVGINTFKEAKIMSDKNDDRIRENFKELAQAIAQLDKDSAVNKVNSDWQYRVTNERIDSAFNSLKCYVDGTFVPGVLKMPADSVCPLPMSRFNNWVAPTATTSTEVVNQASKSAAQVGK